MYVYNAEKMSDQNECYLHFEIMSAVIEFQRNFELTFKNGVFFNEFSIFFF